MTTMDSIKHELWDLLIKQKYYILSIFTFFTILSCFDFKIGKEAYFYTLSTISQTLAALIGIIAIFVIFKLDRFKTERRDSFKKLYTFFEGLREREGYELCDALNSHYKSCITDDDLLNKLSSTIENFDFNGTHSGEIKNFVRKMQGNIDHIRTIEKHIEPIPKKFSILATVVLSTIILSILALPLGWFIVPIGILSNLSILKLPFVVSIVYLTILSIFQTKKFLDYVINSND